MCGRYQIRVNAAKMREVFHVEVPDDFEVARYNVAPTQTAPVVREHADGRTLDGLAWGFTPFWAKDAKVSQINARAEGVATSRMFAKAFRSARCIVPMTAFYEWDPTSKPKQPYMIRLGDGEPFGVAGIWSRWKPADGEPIDTYAVLTTEASPSVAKMGHHRMPVILLPEQYDLWLDRDVQDPERLTSLLRPWPEDLAATPISTRINNARNEGPECIEELVN